MVAVVISHISIVSGLSHIFVFKWFCLLGFVRLRSPDIEGVPLPRDVKDSFNVSTFFRFSGRIFYACLLVKVYSNEREGIVADDAKTIEDKIKWKRKW